MPTLFAALSVLNGQVIGDCMPRHRHQEFIRFLKKIDEETPAALVPHLIVDNYGTHKHAAVKRWLKRHPRIHLHFTRPQAPGSIPQVFDWTASVETILAKIAKCKEALDAVH